jgi:hypothetical protein
VRLTAALLSWLALAFSSAPAADSPPAVPTHIAGLRTEPNLPMPSATRVIVVAFLTIALAAGTLLVVKRGLPRNFLRTDRTPAALKVVTRASLSRSLHLHVVEFEADRILIVEGRSGLEVAVLKAPAATAEPPASA